MDVVEQEGYLIVQDYNASNTGGNRILRALAEVAKNMTDNKRYYKLIRVKMENKTKLAKLNVGGTELRYYAGPNDARAKGVYELSADSEVSMKGNTVIKLRLTGKTVLLRPEGDQDSALAKTTASAWYMALKSEMNRLWLNRTNKSTRMNTSQLFNGKINKLRTSNRADTKLGGRNI